MTANMAPDRATIPRKITRKELYDMVWAEPVSKLAKKLGVSGVAVAKWCKKLGVPRPGRGYWARVEAGQCVKKTPLPKAAKGQDRCVHPHRGGQAATPQAQQADVPGLDAFTFPIPVPEDAGEEHQLVTAARRAFEHATTDDTGLLRPRARKRLDISVSETNKDRSLRIMNALVVAIENAGHRVEVVGSGDDEGTSTAYRTLAVIDDEEIVFSLREKVERKQREPTTAERKKMERDYFFRGPFYEVAATGKLSLKIEGDWYGESHRRTWSDGKRQRLENSLPGFIRSLLLSAHSIKRRRRESEERKIREEQERIRREEQRKREREELKRRLAMENAAFGWGHAERIRNFLIAVEAAVASDSEKTAESEAAFAEWIEWARWYADQVDPLLPSDRVATRMATIPDDRFTSAGYRDSMEQIRRHVQSIANDLSALESRMRYGRGW